MDFIFKGFPKAVFSEQADLNLVPSDFGDEMINIAFDDEVVKRLKTATGTVASPQIFAEVSVTLNIKKTSPQYVAYKDRITSNTVIPGQVDIYDDANQHYTLLVLSVKPAGFNANGNDAVVQFTLQGNMLVNIDLIQQLGI